MYMNISAMPDLQVPAAYDGKWSRLVKEIGYYFSSELLTTDDKNTLVNQFKEIIERENALISKICFSYADSVADYDDLRQDALINIWRGMKQFRNNASQRTWVYRVTINSCISTIRKLNRHKHDSLDKLYSYVADNDDDRDSIEMMHGIISRLGLQERATIMMWLDEMTYDEIADALGVNRNTVASRIRRIKEKIAKQFIKE
ncbi:MAG: RNA polymerase sigma factor [Muribaculaceae bacterium]|nr:RNA polymerase sigma factor [Muribaculaceae bacterium]